MFKAKIFVGGGVFFSRTLYIPFGLHEKFTGQFSAKEARCNIT